MKNVNQQGGSTNQDPRVIIMLDPNNPENISVGTVGRDMAGNHVQLEKPEKIGSKIPKKGDDLGHEIRAIKPIEITFTKTAPPSENELGMYYVWIDKPSGPELVCIPC